jgi:hypothetical protein
MNPDSTQLLIGIGLFELIRENVCIYIYHIACKCKSASPSIGPHWFAPIAIYIIYLYIKIQRAAVF